MANKNGNPEFGVSIVGKKPTKAKPLRVQDLRLELAPEDAQDIQKVTRAFLLPRLLDYYVVLHNRAVFDADKDSARYLIDRLMGPVKTALDEQDSLRSLLSTLVRAAQEEPGEGPELESPADDLEGPGVYPQP